MTQPLDYFRPTPTRARIQLARAVAVGFDLLQVALTPVTFEGAFSPVDDGLDLVAAAVLTWLVGWHVAFVPSFFVKLMPVADLAPTWTLATAIATAGRVPAALPGPGGPGRPMPMLPVETVPPARRRASMLRSAVLFAAAFVPGFLIGGWLVLPHVWAGAATATRAAFWEHNWPGALIGGGLGLWLARPRAGRAALV